MSEHAPDDLGRRLLKGDVDDALVLPGTIEGRQEQRTVTTEADEFDGVNFIIGDGVAAISTGEQGHIRMPFGGTIMRVDLLADQSGSIVVDIWKDTYDNFPPTNADTITGGSEPTISTATKYTDSTLSGWQRRLVKGDILAFNVDSITTCTRVTVILHLAPL